MTEIVTAFKEIIQDLLKHKGTRAAITIVIAGGGIVFPFTLESCSIGPVEVEFQTLSDEGVFEDDSTNVDTIVPQDGTLTEETEIAK